MLDKPAVPVNPQWKEVMTALCTDTPNILDFYERCAQCGLPCDAEIAEVKAQHDFAQRFLEAHFPSTM